MIRTRIILEGEKRSVPLATDDRIFLGEGLFETLKVMHARPCWPYQHWQRLNNAAKKLGIPFDLSYENWLDYLLQQIKRDNLYHGGIKAILTGSSAPRSLVACGQVSQLMLQTFNYTIQTAPLRLLSAPWLRDAANPIYQVKSVNYLEAILARRQSLALGVDDVLFFNFQNHATETTCANLFVIQDQKLFTPPLSDGILPGITRARLLACAQQLDITCMELPVTRDQLKEADAVFVSNSLQGIRSVLTLDDMMYPVKHPLLTQLISFL